ncbi:hypothetical protein Tco_1138889 [Tanacetum coccineum]
MQPVAPPSPDYIPGPEDPQTPPVPQDEDEPEEQPLPLVDSPTAESPGYVTESDPEEDPEEYEDDETEDGPVDYPMDGGDDGDDDDGDSSGDDADDEDEDDEDEEGEEEEHLAPADSAIDIPVDEHVFPYEGTKPIIPPPSTDITIGARVTVPPAHSSPLPMPSPLLPSSGCPTQIQTLRIASTQALIDAVTAALPSPPLPPLPPSLYIPPLVDCRDDIPESEQPPRKRLCLSTLGSKYEVGESSTARPTRELAELHEHDTQDLYALLEDAQDSRSRISQRVDMDSQRVNLLMGDRMTLQETMVEEEAYASREAWAHSIGLSQATHQELQTHRDHVYAHETHLQAHQTQLQLQETLRVIRDMRREMSDMQAELLALRGQQRRARQPGPDARIPDHQDASGDVILSC